jgi:hypothetical protein
LSRLNAHHQIALHALSINRVIPLEVTAIVIYNVVRVCVTVTRNLLSLTNANTGTLRNNLVGLSGLGKQITAETTAPSASSYFAAEIRIRMFHLSLPHCERLEGWLE